MRRSGIVRLTYHAASMRSRRFALSAMIVVALGLAGCTGDSAPSSTAPVTPSESELPTTDISPVPFVPGQFAYSAEGIDAQLEWHGGQGTLTVANGTDADVGEPGLYAVTQEQTRVDASVKEADALAPGDEATFDVSFPAGLKTADAGFIVLLLGDVNYGALAPVPESG
jgi:hypothetical protein